jgi:hypothetical protein
METENRQTDDVINELHQKGNENKESFLKRTNIQKIICIAVIVVGICFIIYGYKDYNKTYNIPSDVLTTEGYSTDSGYDYSSNSIKKPSASVDVIPYVGGDAYNFVIAASLKAGKLSSATIIAETEKSIATNYILVGTILLCFSLIVLSKNNK